MSIQETNNYNTKPEVYQFLLLPVLKIIIRVLDWKSKRIVRLTSYLQIPIFYADCQKLSRNVLEIQELFIFKVMSRRSINSTRHILLLISQWSISEHLKRKGRIWHAQRFISPTRLSQPATVDRAQVSHLLFAIGGLIYALVTRGPVQFLFRPRLVSQAWNMRRCAPTFSYVNRRAITSVHFVVRMKILIIKALPPLPFLS